MFGKLFGSKAQKSNVSINANDAIQQLRGAVVQLEKRECHLQKKITACLTAAKLKSKQNNKNGAIFELKKKKQLQKQCDSLQQKILNLEIQIMSLEDAILNKRTMESMKTAKTAMTATMKDCDPDTVDELMDDLNEQMEMVQDINEAMSQPIGIVMDDDELESELMEIEAISQQEMNSKQNKMHQVPVAVNMEQGIDKLFDIKHHVDEEEIETELASLEMDVTVDPKAKVLMNFSQCPRCV